MKHIRRIAWTTLIGTVPAAGNGCGSMPAGSSVNDSVTSALASTPQDLGHANVSRMAKAGSAANTPSHGGTDESASLCGSLPTHVVANGAGGSLHQFAGTSVHIVPVFWGPNVASDTVSNIQTFEQIYSDSSQAQMIKSEYGYPGTSPIVERPITLTLNFAASQPPPGATLPLFLAPNTIVTELNWQVSNHKLPSASGTSYIFAVHLPPNIVPT